MTGALGRLRLDRALTLHLVGPLRHLVDHDDHGLPILMYHSISAADEANLAAYYRLNTDPATFATQMGFLKKQNYQVISLGQAVAATVQGAALPPKAVVLTFDDGFQDFYTHAYPILSQYGFTATVFLPTGYIGQDAKPFKGKWCLNWPEIRELHRAGIDFGSHTVSHPQLRTLARELVTYEVQSSLGTISDQLGARVESFSYPYRFPEVDRNFKVFVRSLLAESGCTCGVSTRIGRSSATDEVYFLKRLPVNSADDQRLFHAKLAGDYDWLKYLQYARKYLRS